MTQLAELLAGIHERGVRVVLVTSGAIAAAIAPLGLRRRPRDLETQQAAAAVGQGLLVRAYSDAFAEHGVLVAQLLLTVEDVLRPKTYRNALNTISRLFRLGVIPIVNENDTVATHEIRFGDNDRLAALIAHLVRADALLLMSDVDGLYTAHPDTPGAHRIDRVDDIGALEVDTSRVGSKVGTGGMRTKLIAADIATQAGVSVVLGHADDLGRALGGDAVGTFFPARRKRRPRRLLWLEFAAEPRGWLHIDEGRGRRCSAGRRPSWPRASPRHAVPSPRGARRDRRPRRPARRPRLRRLLQRRTGRRARPLERRGRAPLPASRHPPRPHGALLTGTPRFGVRPACP
ncbi:glutamate 5-kinase [Tessaracoccus coleopterorum]|uniref:glutamate 5-kinase n=1 Tax=Tessaracoccus coleopterorum TaxID=2714950 RepID=UPI002F9194C9